MNTTTLGLLAYLLTYPSLSHISLLLRSRYHTYLFLNLLSLPSPSFLRRVPDPEDPEGKGEGVRTRARSRVVPTIHQESCQRLFILTFLSFIISSYPTYSITSSHVSLS